MLVHTHIFPLAILTRKVGQTDLVLVCGEGSLVGLRRSTQPGHPSVVRRDEYQPQGGNALPLASKGRYGSCVGDR